METHKVTFRDRLTSRILDDAVSTAVVYSNKGKGKVHPRRGHKYTDGEKRYIPTLSLTSALDGVGFQRHAPASLTPEKNPVPIV